MKDFCEIEYCENPGFKVVRTSAERACDGKRTLCAPCEEAFSWGVSHGMRIAGWKPGMPIHDTPRKGGSKRKPRES